MGCLHSAALRVVRTAAEKDRSSSSSIASSSRDSGASASTSSDSGSGIFALEPAVVAESSLRSLNYQSGIVLLEEMLLVRRGDLKMGVAAKTAIAKTGKTAPGVAGGGGGADTTMTAADSRAYDEANSDSWLQLSRLYAALGEKDVLVGISLRAAQNEVHFIRVRHSSCMPRGILEFFRQRVYRTIRLHCGGLHVCIASV